MWLLLTGIQRGREEQPRETRVSRPSAASRWWLRILKLPRRTNPVQRWRPAWLRLTTGTPPPLTSLPTSLTIYIITGIFGTSVYFSVTSNNNIFQTIWQIDLLIFVNCMVYFVSIQMCFGLLWFSAWNSWPEIHVGERVLHCTAFCSRRGKRL